MWKKIDKPLQKCKMTSSVKREDYKFKAPSNCIGKFLKGHYKWEGSYTYKKAKFPSHSFLRSRFIILYYIIISYFLKEGYSHK